MKKIGIILLILSNMLLFAQVPVFQNASFHNYSMKNGLSFNNCVKVIQDSIGYIWVATYNGLQKFNGTNWEYYSTISLPTKHQLSSNYITDISYTKNKLYINTTLGVNVYDYKTDSIELISIPIKGWGKIAASTNAIFISSWLGVEKYDNYQKNYSLNYSFYETSQNTINQLTLIDHYLFATPEDKPSLIQIDTRTNRCSYYSKINGAPDKLIINSVASYAEDTLVMSTRQGVYLYKISTNTCIDLPRFREVYSKGIKCTKLYTYHTKKYLLVGTIGNGFYVYDINSKKSYHLLSDIYNPVSLLSDFINDIYVDKNNGIWIATTKGLSYFHPSMQNKKYYYFHTYQELPNNVIFNTIHEFKPGEFYLGTDNNGLYYYNSINEHIAPISSIPSNTKITDIIENKSRVLIASNNGLYEGINERFTKTSQLDLKYEYIFNIHKNEDYLLFATHNGAYIYNDDLTKQIFKENISIKDSKTITKDVLFIDNKLYILRFFDGLEIVDLSQNNKKSIFPLLTYAPSDFENMILYNNYLIISTNNGIVFFDRTSSNYTVLTTKDGLESNNILSVLIRDNKLYYTTNTGLYIYDWSIKKSIMLTSYENYANRWFNQLKIQKDSSILFTVSDYFMTYKPEIRSMKSTPITIEECLVNNRSYKLDNSVLNLSSNENNIKIKVCNFDYISTKDEKFTFEIPELNTDLKNTNGVIELLNLAPGNYTLIIRPINNENEKLVLKIKIKQPFFQTWWFYLLLFLLITGIVGVIFWYRSNQKKKLMYLRNQISRDLHDELGANISSMNIMANLLLNNPANKDTIVSNIISYSNQVNETIHDIIWNINPNLDSLEDVILKMTRYASDSFEAVNMNYSIENNVDSIKYKLLDEQKYYLYLIFKEGITNCIKYSKAENVMIRFEFKSNILEFTIQDNGIGFNQDTIVLGNGLENMRYRSQTIGSELTILSKENIGTTINLKLKLK